MRSLDRKILRDLWHLRGQVLAIALVVASGVAVLVMALSTNIHSGFPLVPLAGAEWASRLPSLWPLFSVYAGEFWEQTEVQYHPPVRRTGLERWFTDVVFEDLQAYRPDLILVLRYHPSATHSGGAHRFDYLGYFGAEPRFREAFEAYDRLDGHDAKAEELDDQLAEQDRKEQLEQEFEELKRRVEANDA